jgi:hypothetical protein
MELLPAVEGLTPSILWYTIVGLVGIGALIVLVDKVADVFRKRKARQALATTPSEAFAETVSEKVKESLEPRFQDIDRKLANDKLLIEDHTRKLAGQAAQIDAIEKGNKVLCRGILALLSHEINGNSTDKLAASRDEITNYLIDK